jgi:hypothetical protein
MAVIRAGGGNRPNPRNLAQSLTSLSAVKHSLYQFVVMPATGFEPTEAFSHFAQQLTKERVAVGRFKHLGQNAMQQSGTLADYDPVLSQMLLSNWARARCNS